MNTAVPRYPLSGIARATQAQMQGPASPLTTFDAARTVELLGAARNSVSTAELLLNFVHNNRNVARQAGVETIVIEIFAVMQGESFSGVIDAIEEAGRTGQSLNLSQGGLATLRRLETLTAEAMANMRRFSDGDFSVVEVSANRAALEADSQRAYLDMEEKRLEMMRRELSMKQENARRQQEAVSSLKSSLGHTYRSPVQIQLAQAEEKKSTDFSFLLPFAIFTALAATAAVIYMVVKEK